MWNPIKTHEPPAAPRATGLRRGLYVSGGVAFVGVAYLGILLPGLPTTPWLLLASYCFARSSPRLERWLKRSPVFGRLIRDWEEHRGIRRPAKVLATCVIVPVVSASVGFTTLPVGAKVLIGCLAAVGLGVIWFVVPTVRNSKEY